MSRKRISSAGPPDIPARTGPVRTCVGCRERVAKSELLRVVAGSDAHGLPAVVPDPDATAPGRGAHLHPTTECFDLAVRRRAFGRALRASDLAVEPLAGHLRAHLSTDSTTDRNWSSSS